MDWLNSAVVPDSVARYPYSGSVAVKAAEFVLKSSTLVDRTAGGRSPSGKATAPGLQQPNNHNAVANKSNCKWCIPCLNKESPWRVQSARSNAADTVCSLGAWATGDARKNVDDDADKYNHITFGDLEFTTCKKVESAWQDWQKKVSKDGDSKEHKNGRIPEELKGFINEQFDRLKADLLQQQQEAENARHKAEDKAKERAALAQQQLQLAEIAKLQQLAEVVNSHKAALAAANSKIGSLASQVRQLNMEKSAYQTQLETERHATAQQEKQVKLLQHQLNEAKTQAAAASNRANSLRQQLLYAQHVIAKRDQQLQQAQQQLQEATQAGEATATETLLLAACRLG